MGRRNTPTRPMYLEEESLPQAVNLDLLGRCARARGSWCLKSVRALCCMKLRCRPLDQWALRFVPQRQRLQHGIVLGPEVVSDVPQLADRSQTDVDVGAVAPEKPDSPDAHLLVLYLRTSKPHGQGQQSEGSHRECSVPVRSLGRADL